MRTRNGTDARIAGKASSGIATNTVKTIPVKTIAIEIKRRFRHRIELNNPSRTTMKIVLTPTTARNEVSPGADGDDDAAADADAAVEAHMSPVEIDRTARRRSPWPETSNEVL